MFLAYGILIEASFLNSSFDLNKIYFIKLRAQVLYNQLLSMFSLHHRLLFNFK